MLNTALGIAQDPDGNGTDALMARHVIRDMYDTPGVIWTGGCDGQNDLRYYLHETSCVFERSWNDGMSIGTWYAGYTDAVSAGDPSNPRIDVVYLKSNDLTQGDPDNRIHVGVAQGVPSPNPIVPSIPIGAVAVDIRRMGAGLTRTANAVKLGGIKYAVQKNGNKGILIDKRNYAEPFLTAQGGVGTSYNANQGSFYLSTKRMIKIDVTMTAQAEAPFPGGVNWMGSGYQEVIIDGQSQDSWHFMLWPGTPFSKQNSLTVELPAGNHTVSQVCWSSGSQPASSVRLRGGGNGANWHWYGQRLTVEDLGQVD